MCAGSDALHQKAALEIGSIGYHADAADVTADTLTVSVEPNVTASTGDEIFQAPRPLQDVWTARFVVADGTEVAAANPVYEAVAMATDHQGARCRSAERITASRGWPHRVARYLALVPDGTGPSEEADTYQAAVISAGFRTSEQSTRVWRAPRHGRCGGPSSQIPIRGWRSASKCTSLRPGNAPPSTIRISRVANARREREPVHVRDSLGLAKLSRQPEKRSHARRTWSRGAPLVP